MPELENSKRIQFKATYVPTRIGGSIQTDGQSGQPTARVLEKVAFLRSLNIQPEEYAQLRDHPVVKRLPVPLATTQRKSAASQLVDVVFQLTSNISPLATQQQAPLLANTCVEDLAALGNALADIRRKIAGEVRAYVEEIESKYQSRSGARPQPGLLTQAAPAGYSPTFLDAVAWAYANHLPAFTQLYKITLAHATHPLSALVMDPVSLIGPLVTGLIHADTDTNAMVDSFVSSFQIEPVGRLHLERLEMTPVGIEHGELVYSVPLTPKETVNITHREWSVTSRTFEDIIQDSFEGFSENGVAEKTDLSQSTDNEERHSSSLDVNGSVSASYNGGSYSVTASAAVDYNTHSDDLHSIKDSHTHSLAITRKASTRTRKDHKTSFRVSSIAGAEDLAVRVLTNPSDKDAMRVDYFQLMRKWRVDLIRYGLRMTYDIVVPNPGIDLIQKVIELQQLTKQIAETHEFSVKLGDITRDTWPNYVQQFGAKIDPPPDDPFEMMQTGTLQKSIDLFTFSTIIFDVPDDYQVTGGHFRAQVHIGDSDFNSGHRAHIGLTGENPGPGSSPMDSAGQFLAKDGVLDVILSQGSVEDRIGKVSLMYQYYNVESGGFIANITASPTPAAILAWQVKAWNQVREADQAAYEARVSQMADRKAQLEAEIGQFDALTLRKMEREEIMKCLLQWIFGPKFKELQDVMETLYKAPGSDPNDPKTQYYLQAQNAQDWQTIMEYGEFIKFIHNAVEWENVIFFAYPYFWDSIHNWPFKRFMVHPDPEHRTFLRAGCARVVLTIRPGFEHDFASLIENWSPLGNLPQGHPYVSIGDEIRNFAMTNYEGIPPANPDNNLRLLLYPEQRKAWSDMQVWLQLIEAYHTMNGVYPAKLNDLQALLPYPNAQNPTITTLPSLKDPWGRNYHYSLPGLNGDYDLVSYGKDGVPGGTDVNADITSWAEGSVVSRWYEYTPTSALDVSINTVLPNTA